MRKIIFDERTQLEEILCTKKVSNISIKNLLMLLVKYYYQDHKNDKVKDYKGFIQNKIKQLEMPELYEDYKYDSYIEKLCRNIQNGKLNIKIKEITSIPITRLEMNLISKCETDKEKKLLFTLYVLAKSILEPTGWVNYSDGQILEYGNLKGCTNLELHQILHDLREKGFITVNNLIGSSGYKVDLGQDITDVTLAVVDFKNLGNQCLNYLKPDWKMCECCGRMIKIKGNIGRPQKYCKKCGKKIDREKARERMRTIKKK